LPGNGSRAQTHVGGFVASVDDHELLRNLIPEHLNPIEAVGYIKASLNEKGYWLSTDDHTRTLRTLLDTKLYIIPYIPTSERWAEHFFSRLRMPVQQQSNGIGQLTNLRLWKTPNCYSDYRGFVCNNE
jgi:6-pyruvoyl tetrahydropterin synthase